MATDTAFVLGALALFGRQHPHPAAGLPAVPVGGRRHRRAERDRDLLLRRDRPGRAGDRRRSASSRSSALSRLRVWRGPAYFAVGAVMWVAMYESGVHATIGGVVLGPAGQRLPPAPRGGGAGRIAHPRVPPVAGARPSPARRSSRSSGRSRRTSGSAPSSSRGAAMSSCPVFALANAGVRIDSRAAGAGAHLAGHHRRLRRPRRSASWSASGWRPRSRCGCGSAPCRPGVSLGSVWSGAALTGLGFTVSLFVTDLAFDDERAAGGGDRRHPRGRRGLHAARRGVLPAWSAGGGGAAPSGRSTWSRRWTPPSTTSAGRSTPR